MAISKEKRLKIYNKYNGRCAYCGCKLEYKDMQVDHIIPQRIAGSTNDLDNLMPTCRTCNHYKRGTILACRYNPFHSWAICINAMH